MGSDLTNLTDKELEILKVSFLAQASEVLELLSEEILKFEKSPDDLDSLKNIQRYVHTLKGDSASMGFNTLSDISHRLEDILHLLREEKLSMDRGIGDLFFSFVDISAQILTNIKEGSANAVDTGGLIDRINKFISAKSEHKAESHEKKQEGYQHLTEYQQLQIETASKNSLSVYEIKIVFDRQCRERAVGAFMISNQLSALGEVVRWLPDIEEEGIEEADAIDAIFITKADKEIIAKNCRLAGISGKVDINPFSFKTPSGTHSAPMPASSERDKARGGKAASHHHDATLRVDAKKVDKIMDLVGELIIGRSMLTQSVLELKERLGKDEAISDLENINFLFERSLTELQNDVMTVRMVPIEHVLRKFPRVIRDMSIEKKKEVKLEMQGAETELDKGIVDVIGEPLIHILRNSIDHGIELPDEREKKGKERIGTIRINSYHEGNQIIIEIEDDGKGINIEKLRKKGVEAGIIKEEEAANMPEEEAIDLIFHSGLSTADEVTDTSGRGIGMDAVKRAVGDLKGLIQVRTIPDMGTKFIIRLPLTLAIIQGMVFKSGERFFAFPLSSILEIRRVLKDEISTINGIESLKWRERIISLIRLSEIIKHDIKENGLLRLARNYAADLLSPEQNKSFVLIIGLAEKRLGILVDKLIGKRELVIKAIDNGSSIASGASILGDGSIVLVLDVLSFIKRAIMPAAGAIYESVLH